MQVGNSQLNIPYCLKISNCIGQDLRSLILPTGEVQLFPKVELLGEVRKSYRFSILSLSKGEAGGMLLRLIPVWLRNLTVETLMRLRWLIVSLILSFVLVGCIGLDSTVELQSETELAGTLPSALVVVTNTPLSADPLLPTPTLKPSANQIALSPTPSLESPTIAPTATEPLPSTPLSTATPPLVTQRYALTAESRSSRDLLQTIILSIRSATVDAATNSLRFEIAFENRGDQLLDLIGAHLNTRDLAVVAPDGTRFEALAIDDTISSITPDDGLIPGGAAIGWLTFPLPPTTENLELQFAAAFSYEPMVVTLDTPLVDAPTTTIAEGIYPVGQSLYSSERVLAPLALQIDEVMISAETVTFNVNFFNNNRQGYSVFGVAGEDAFLLDAAGRQFRPSNVSETLTGDITPTDGWRPKSGNPGSISFPRPKALGQVRFIFSGYSPLTLNFDSSGLVQSAITSGTGGAPPPPPTPTARDAAYEAIDALLAQQAAALLDDSTESWLAFFADSLQPSQAAAHTHTQALPINAINFAIAQGETIGAEVEGGMIDGLEVEMIFLFEGQEDNPFRYSADYDLIQIDGQWRISNLEFKRDRPFWWDKALAQQSTEHFLLFALPEIADELTTFEIEAETAWSTLAAKGIPLADRYIAYYTATQDEFRELAGGTTRQLGVARSLYQFSEGDIVTTNRIFFINGEAFNDEAVLAANDQQTTVTHELVHLAFSQRTRPFTPPWIAEGIAMYYSDDISAESRAGLLASDAYPDISLEKLTAANSLGEWDFIGSRGSAEYTFAGELYNYLVQTYGEQMVLDFYDAFGAFAGEQLEERLPQGFNPFGLDSAMSTIAIELTPQLVEQFFGVTLPDLESNFRNWLDQSP